MNTFLGFPRSVVAIAVSLAVILLIIFVGTIIIGGSVLNLLVFPVNIKDPIPAATLLLVVIVLLIGIFCLLLLLLWCSCQSRKNDIPLDLFNALLPLLPLLPQIKDGLKDTAIALHDGGQALKWIRRNIGDLPNQAQAAGSELINIADHWPNINFTIPATPRLIRDNSNSPWHLDFMHINQEQTINTDDLKDALRNVGTKLNQNAQDIDDITEALGQAGVTVGKIAKALGSDPGLAVTEWQTGDYS